MSESSGAPGSQTSLREANSIRLLECLRSYGQLTQVELAAATGLSPATISNIVRHLSAVGVVETTATTRSGRRAQLVTLKLGSAVSAGIHITRRSLRVALVEQNLTIIIRQQLPLPLEHRFDTTLDRAVLLVSELCEQTGHSTDNLVGIGVTLPTSSTFTDLSTLPTWEGVDIAEIIQHRLKRPTLVMSEVEAAASFETRGGALRGIDLGMYVRVAESTDSALAINGSLLKQPRQTPGLGHVQVSPVGAICRCGGRGCLNTVVSIEAMRELLRMSHGAVSLQHIIQGAINGDRGCQHVVNDVGSVIGTALANISASLGFQRIVIGGALTATSEILLAPMRDALAARPALGPTSDVLIAGNISADTEMLGAAAQVFDLLPVTEVFDSVRGDDNRA